MNVYRRYFKVAKGPLVDAVVHARQVNKEAWEKYQEILSDIGAKPGYYQTRNCLVAVVFEKEPDRYLYKRSGKGWYPKRNIKEGRALHERFAAVKTIDEQKCLKEVGLTDNPTIFGSNRAHCPSLTIIPSDTPVLFVLVPWYDEDPEKLARYVKDREKGSHYNGTLDAVLWCPTKDMLEVKEWEYLRSIDEWNESVRENQI